MQTTGLLTGTLILSSHDSFIRQSSVAALICLEAWSTPCGTACPLRAVPYSHSIRQAFVVLCWSDAHSRRIVADRACALQTARMMGQRLRHIWHCHPVEREGYKRWSSTKILRAREHYPKTVAATSTWAKSPDPATKIRSVSPSYGYTPVNEAAPGPIRITLRS